MVSLDEAVIARLVVKGEHFEVLIAPEAAQKLRDGEDIDILDNLAIDEIFKDVKKGYHAAEERLKSVFGTLDTAEIARQIVLRGEIQLTTEQRRKMQESKRKQIIAVIARNAINPQTRLPHPPTRIELAMEEAKVRVDPFKPVDVQVQEVLEALKPVIPIRFEKVVIAVKLAPEDYGKAYGDLRAMGKITKEEWQPTGEWIGLVEIPAGMQTEFYERLNARTRGNAETRLIEE